MLKKISIIFSMLFGLLFALPSFADMQYLLAIDFNSAIKEKYEQIGDKVREQLFDKKQSFIPFDSLKIIEDNDYNQAKITFNIKKDKDIIQTKERLNKALGKDFDILSEDKKISIKYSNEVIEKITKDINEECISVLKQRIKDFGTKKSKVYSKDKQHIYIQLPNNHEIPMDIIITQNKLTFHLVDENPNESNQGVLSLPHKQSPGKSITIYKKIELSDKNIKDAKVDIDIYGRPVVSTELDKEGTEKFAKLTTEHVGEKFAIVLDDEIISSPVINEPIHGGRGQISGSFTFDEAKKFAILLKSHSLPAKITIIEETRTQNFADKIKSKIFN